MYECNVSDVRTNGEAGAMYKGSLLHKLQSRRRRRKLAGKLPSTFTGMDAPSRVYLLYRRGHGQVFS